MTPLASEGQILDFKNAAKAAEPSPQAPVHAPGDRQSFELRERISSTVKAARAQRELEIQQATDRAAAARLVVQQKAIDALLLLLSDDALNRIIGKHASLGELHTGTVKVTKHGVELIRSGSAGASQMSGEKLDIPFTGSIPQSAQQLNSIEFQQRAQLLRVQGVEIVGIYDAAGQSILITFDYGAALS
jgi:hypothetical protein